MGPLDAEWRAFRDAVQARQFDVASEQLASDSRLLDLRNGLGETVLHFFAVEDDLDAMTWLSERNASLDTKNDFGTPVLFEVALLGYRTLFAWFVLHGADFAALDGEGRGIIDYLSDYGEEAMVDFASEQMVKARGRRPH